MSNASVRYTMLNGMAGAEIVTSMRQQAAWGVFDLDLKDSIFGKRIEDIDEAEARQVAALALELKQRVYSLSSGQLGATIETLLSPNHAGMVRAAVQRLITTARILRPRFIRLVTPTSREVDVYRAELHRETGGPLEPIFAMYRDAIDAITDAGFEVTIENEAFGCLLASPGDVLAFFKRLNRPSKAVFTWDVQNLWEGGTFPSLDVYRQLRPLMGFYHLKGGRSGEDETTLAWKSTLADATWPVLEITRAVIADGVSPVICLNPCHGKIHPDFPMDNYVTRDLEFLRTHLS